ncbi:hypothetical protein [Bizionia arctica]|uniref:GLPGLI family protein n=1 Tax=Bizionia arctica TaxID=1495645 RepID=A0A917LLG9_9FLAO|nr:hypothetical protein [Bizionia arctica]GGG39898.1 hypothetical protein GCM10010976_09450 [Bizionia arctica]
MKTYVLVFLSFLACNIFYSQAQPKIEDYSLGSLDVNVMVIPFGMENPIKVGTMSKSGDIILDFSKELPDISKEEKESDSSKLWYTLFSQCENRFEIVEEKDNIFSFDTGALSLWTSDERYVGVIFTVSDENLVPWIEDPAYMEPIMASYFELIYVAKPFQYKGNCNTTRMMEEGEEDVKIDYTYNLNLKAGFNFIEYRIESIYKTDPNIMASFPDKISVTSVEGIPNCKWVGKYF